MPKRIVYIGCKEMGYKVLEFLHRNYKKQLVGVFTLSPELANNAAGYADFTPLLSKVKCHYEYVKKINDPFVAGRIRELQPDLIIQVAWSEIIQDQIIRTPPLGMVGFHASLLPKDRGGSPVNWAIIRGEKNWGSTMFFMEAGVDSGDIICQRKFKISRLDTCKTVYQKATKANLNMLRKMLPALLLGQAPKTKQDILRITVNKRRKPSDGIIDWYKTAEEIYNGVRALTHPYPGAFTYLNQKKLYLWRVSVVKTKKTHSDKSPGLLIRSTPKSLWVKTGKGVVALRSVQLENEPEILGYQLVGKVHENFSFSSASR